MHKSFPVLVFVLLFFVCFRSGAQVLDLPEEGGTDDDRVESQGPARPCITAEEEAVLEKRLQENYRLLGLDEKATSAMTTKFYWPLRQANGLNDCSYFTIRNYVDQEPIVDSTRDWSCGRRTYDGHRGLDITPYPYTFYKMDNNQVEIVAAAPGTIVAKADGAYDRNCAWITGATANYVVIRHADGSTARYWHMKKNSVTQKAVGQTVETGEYLGVVGSSGISTNPHLHFEVLKTQSTQDYVDPFGGVCNSQNDSTLWVSQLPYIDPGILKVSVNPVSPVFPECPETETPNEDSCYLGGTQAKFYIFVRDQRDSTAAAMRILRPDGSAFITWTKAFTSSSSRSWWAWTRTLPNETGTYLFEAAYNGEICSKPFKINCQLTDAREKVARAGTLVFPNPVSIKEAIRFDPPLQDARIRVYNGLGHLVWKDDQVSGSWLQFPDAKWKPGVYHIQIRNGSEDGGFVKLLVVE